MNEEKLSSDEVPQKFAEWLLSLGCPPENVPSVDKVAEMCRGQYYMVWRSLMERVKSKDVVRRQRLQVFCDDVNKCQKSSVFREHNSNVVVPEELSLWKQHTDLREKAADSEARIKKDKENLHRLMDKVSRKLAQRNLSRKRLQDSQRRAWLLQQLSEELKEKRANLQETKSIADSLCGLDDGEDIESKLEKCLTALSRRNNTTAGVSLLSVANPAACSSIASTSANYDEEQISTLVKCRGDILFRQLYERRAGLCSAMPVTQPDKANEDSTRITPQSVLSHTAALHCNLALEAMKNRVHIVHSRNRLAARVKELSNYLSGEACELLVIRCERARSEARLSKLRGLCEELTDRTGIFATGAHQSQDTTAGKHIHNVDRVIESKRDELKRLITSAATVERKTQNVKECLVTLFNSFHDDGIHDQDKFAGRPSIQLEPISTLRQFYEEKRDKRRDKMELSMDFDVSENCSFTDPTDNGSLKFVDELRIYLKKFNLEKNRKLVLESGEKIWLFETLQSSLDRLYTQWQTDDMTTSLLCPSVALQHNLCRLAWDVAANAELEDVVRELEVDGRRNGMTFDIKPTITEEQKILDKVKKRLNENILSLQKTNKTLDVGMDNLQLWSDNNVRKYISVNRTIDGKTYKDYENTYLECLGV